MVILGRMTFTFISSSDHVNRYVFYAVTTVLSAVFSFRYSYSRNDESIIIGVATKCVNVGEYTNKLLALYTPAIYTRAVE